LKLAAEKILRIKNQLVQVGSLQADFLRSALMYKGAAVNGAAARIIYDYQLTDLYPALCAMLEQKLNHANLAEAVYRRALHAAYYLGTSKSARQMVNFCRREDVTDEYKKIALGFLSQWRRMPQRENVWGEFRSSLAREKDSSAYINNLFKKHISEIRNNCGGQAQERAASIEARFARDFPSNILLQAIKSKRNDSFKHSALDTLFKRRGKEGNDTILTASQYLLTTKADSSLIVKALSYLSAVDTSLALKTWKDSFQRASLDLQQQLLIKLPKEIAADALVYSFTLIQSKRLSVAVHLDFCEAVAKQGSLKLQLQVTSWKKRPGAKKYNMLLVGGSPAIGKKIFFHHGAAQCQRCHKVNGNGGDVGPNLSEIGSQQAAAVLLESLINPGAKLAQGFAYLNIELKDGKTYYGPIVEETAKHIKLLVNKKEQLILRQDITQKTVIPSLMPSMQSILKERELRDLISWLESFKKQKTVTH
ncbi:MAG: c-type cytochrome, partial [Lentisphaeraceae bacterium]|nr:c-type cytochrome [Lentisphaeraceae bacterium]